MKKYFVWTHYDLDGIMCYLLLKWFLKIDIEFKSTLPKKFRDDYTQWMANNTTQYDKIFITDLDIAEHADLVDKPNVIIIDHHKSHNDNFNYKHATTVIRPETSAAKLLYKTFKDKFEDITIPQKKLLLLVDDYDCYKLDLPDSRKLNILFWNSNNAFETFVKDFNHGFTMFNVQQETAIKYHLEKIQKIFNEAPIYSGNITIQGKKRSVCATFVNKYINDIVDMVYDKYKSDLIIVVNTNQQSVHFRRGKHCTDLDVSEFAKKIADGGGHEFAGGGKITENFMQFTKLLGQIK